AAPCHRFWRRGCPGARRFTPLCSTKVHRDSRGRNPGCQRQNVEPLRLTPYFRPLPRASMCRSVMLRAGLIGFPSSGKTALFQLPTSAREAPRSSGRQEANVGVSRVPDDRLDRLTALFRPRKHVPATVEFADMGGATSAKSGAAALLDVAAFRNADALLHVVRMFRDPSIPHAAGSVDPARDVRTMEDELILADLGVVERRLERLEKDLKKQSNAELKKEQEILQA